MSDEFLDRLVGDWTYEGHSLPDDGQRHRGAERVTRRDRWVVIEADDHARFQLTFDPDTGRVVGDFVSWKWSHLWTYDGSAAGDRMTLASRGPAMDADRMPTDYEDVWQIVSPDERLTTARVRGPDGRWRDFNVTRYRRT